MMRITGLSLLAMVIMLASCSSDPGTYNPDTKLGQHEKQEFLLEVLPYFAKLPQEYDERMRFDPSLDSFYREEAGNYTLQYYYFSPVDSAEYFIVTRPAPSLYGKRTGIAAKVKHGRKGGIQEYEEVFWMYKMKPEELNRKALVLFKDWVTGKSLEQYMPGKRPEEWIEFPNGQYVYDKVVRRWVPRKVPSA